MAIAGFEFNAQKLLVAVLVLMVLAFFIGFSVGFNAGKNKSDSQLPKIDRPKLS